MRSATASPCWPTARWSPARRWRRSNVSTTPGCRNTSTARAPARPGKPPMPATARPPDMETKANYVLIGAFTLVVTLFLLLFALWAAKYSSEKDWRHYGVVFNEPVTGLTEGSPVLYNGIAVGTIDALRLAPDDPRRVLATIRIQASTPVKTDTRAKISTPSLTAPPVIQLTGGSPNAPRLADVDGNEIPIIQTEASALQNIADTAQKLVSRVDDLLSDENVKRISNSLANIEAMTGAIGGQREDLRTMIISARRSSEQLEKTLATTNRAMTDIDRELVQKLPGLVE